MLVLIIKILNCHICFFFNKQFYTFSCPDFLIRIVKMSVVFYGIKSDINCVVLVVEISRFTQSFVLFLLLKILQI